MAAGDLAGADSALQGLDKFNGFEPLKVFQLALLYDYAGKADKARAVFRQGARRQRAAQLAADRRDRQFRRAPRPGRPGEGPVPALHPAEQRQRSGSVGGCGAACRPTSTDRSGSPADGLAEAMFDLASVLNQAETIDLALRLRSLRPRRAAAIPARPAAARRHPQRPEQARAKPRRARPRSRPARLIPGRRGCAARSTSTRSTAATRRSPSSRRWRRKTPS